MEPKLKIFKTPLEVAEVFAAELKVISDERPVDKDNINISGSNNSGDFTNIFSNKVMMIWSLYVT